MALLLDAHLFLLPPIKKQRLPPPPTNEYPHPSLSLSLSPHPDASRCRRLTSPPATPLGRRSSQRARVSRLSPLRYVLSGVLSGGFGFGCCVEQQGWVGARSARARVAGRLARGERSLTGGGGVPPPVRRPRGLRVLSLVGILNFAALPPSPESTRFYSFCFFSGE